MPTMSNRIRMAMSGLRTRGQTRSARSKGNHESFTMVLADADSYPRRMEIGPDGMIYSGEYAGGKMLQFTPRRRPLGISIARPGSQSVCAWF